MPPVRWKFLLVAGLTLVQLLIFADAQQIQESISMSSDGWRPIIGTRKLPAFEPEIKAQEITQYKNPSQNIEIDIVKAETILPSTTIAPQKMPLKVSTDTINNNINGEKFFKQGGKIPPHSKFTSPGPYHTIPSSAHDRPHIPIGAAHRPGQFAPMQKRPLKPPNKPLGPHFGNLKRKPIRVAQIASPSSRDEVFVRPPNSGFPSFIKGPVKTRDTQSLVGNGHFSIKPSSNIDFSNGFVLPPATDNFQQFKSQPVFIFSQSPSSNNEIRFQNDVYTRNLVPPPLSQFQQEKEKINNNIKDNAVAVTDAVIKLSEFHNNQHQFGLKPAQYQENLVPQLPPSFEQSFSFQKQFNKPKDGATDVQVTKEKLKAFHSSPPVYNTNDYIDYDFHTVKKPETIPKLQTYEVTEGRWVDNPNPFTFSFTEPQPIPPQKLVMLPSARPTPSVELNVPPFLPTPYRPDGVVPTSPTQNEASTVFNQVSTKMNRYKNEALTKNPLFFDVKEVSTHYPILGKPAPLADSTAAMNGEISNEITTLKQVQISEEVDPATKRPKTRRRRPQPRRTTTTSTTTTTTTTEEPPVTESYEVQKTQEVYEEASMETERPQRRPRPRPNRIRTNNNYDTEDITEKRIRGRHRHRQRGNVVGYGTKTDVQTELPRKRKRPLNIESTSNHRMPEDSLPMSDETTEVIAEQPRPTEQEAQGIFETKYIHESDEATTSRPGRIESELPGRHYEARQSEEESKYTKTIVSSESPPHRSRYGQEKEEQTDRGGLSVDTTTERDTTASIHLPENEIDYSTPVPTVESDDGHIQATLATTLPTTTTTEATTKSHRIRGRPVKYGSSNRPRFSVKDYRQRLNQYTSTTPSTATDIVKTTSDGIRLRFPTRKLRTRPTTRTTTPSYYEPEEEHTESIRRGGFKPKEPRHGVTSTEATFPNIITEKNVKSVNTRLRPFGRYKPTTEASSTTSKVSIKPNLFSARRRSQAPLNLRMKAYNKLIKNTTEETTTYGSEVELTEPITVQTTESEDETTEIEADKLKNTELTTEASESTTVDLSEVDYSQRVSELTSSFKNQYETPGLFKSVSPNSRRIPSYFTISTDDPILPIEAFFPNLKDKTR